MAEEKSERCGYYLQQKRRYCRMDVAKGNQYCGEHLVFANSSGLDHVRKRIPCPLDPKHSVFVDALKKHLKKCNAGRKTTPVCYTRNINSGGAVLDKSDLRPLSEYPQDVVGNLIARVTEAYQKLEFDLADDILEHPSMSRDLTDPTNGIAALKHLKQQSSIIAHLAKLDLLRDKTCYVEFGAGRGKLSRCIQKALSQDVRNVNLVLVDRANCRRKVEGKYKTASLVGVNFHRLLIDIEHLDLSKMEYLRSLEHLVGVSKHLCGAATDLTLRCLVNYSLKCHRKSCETDQGGQVMDKDGEFSGLPFSASLSGVVIALCCHHRCSWSSLVGREFLIAAGFTSHDCHMICHMTSWAVCGTRPSNEGVESQRKQEISTDDCPPSKKPKLSSGTSDSKATDSHSFIPIPDATLEPDHEDIHISRGYVPHAREHIGIKCKRLIDCARVSYLKNNGFDAKLLYFVDRKTSLENVLLIAIPTQ